MRKRNQPTNRPIDAVPKRLLEYPKGKCPTPFVVVFRKPESNDPDLRNWVWDRSYAERCNAERYLDYLVMSGLQTRETAVIVDLEDEWVLCCVNGCRTLHLVDEDCPDCPPRPPATAQTAEGVTVEMVSDPDMAAQFGKQYIASLPADELVQDGSGRTLRQAWAELLGLNPA